MKKPTRSSDLLKQLDLIGELASIDAIACNPAIAQQIVDAGSPGLVPVWTESSLFRS
jgi:hypothetical protein